VDAAWRERRSAPISNCWFWREINVMSDINENQQHSRPSRYTLLIGLGVILCVGVIAYWSEISTFAHIPQFKKALGL
jgi:hypothetical protein